MDKEKKIFGEKITRDVETRSENVHPVNESKIDDENTYVSPDTSTTEKIGDLNSPRKGEHSPATKEVLEKKPFSLFKLNGTASSMAEKFKNRKKQERAGEE